jgi:hypothetical protein
VPHFTIRPLAWREINKQLDYLEEQAGLETAERFLNQLIRSFDSLTRMLKRAISAASVSRQRAASAVGR